MPIIYFHDFCLELSALTMIVPENIPMRDSFPRELNLFRVTITADGIFKHQRDMQGFFIT